MTDINRLIYEKTCTICKMSKSIQEFYNSPRGKYKKQGFCKKCAVILARKFRATRPELTKKNEASRYKRHKEKRLKLSKDDFNKNKESRIARRQEYQQTSKYKEKNAKWKKEWYEKNKEEISRKRKEYSKTNKDKLRNTALKRIYGITLEQYRLMLLEQSNQCAICFVGLKIPHIDHCHKTKKIRGILCTNCNTGIGQLKDNIEILQNAIKYIRKHK